LNSEVLKLIKIQVKNSQSNRKYKNN